jgi:tRNA (guanine-N7-)-methyltransferase
VTEPAARPTRILYGRRQGKKLRPARQALMDDLLPRLRIGLPAAGHLDSAPLFPSAVIAGLWLEIGFGAGEHLAWQARNHPDKGLIGCEPFINGMAALLSQVATDDLNNVRVFDDDARLLMDSLAEASVDRLFILFPDPWPKTRHHKRRVVNGETLDVMARILSDGAELRLATDHRGYCRWMIEHIAPHPAFEWLARGPKDWRRRPDDWPETRYESKALTGSRPVFLRYRRRNRA